MSENKQWLRSRSTALFLRQDRSVVNASTAPPAPAALGLWDGAPGHLICPENEVRGVVNIDKLRSYHWGARQHDKVEMKVVFDSVLSHAPAVRAANNIGNTAELALVINNHSFKTPMLAVFASGKLRGATLEMSGPGGLATLTLDLRPECVWLLEPGQGE